MNAAVPGAYERLYGHVPAEHDVVLSSAHGRVPEGLVGTLYRNGPARWRAGGSQAAHLFDGDGMVSRFRFDGGRVHFRSRYVRTPKFLAGERGIAVRGLGTERAGGWRANALRPQGDRANTHVVLHAGRLLALSDDGRPFRIDRETLETCGPCTFGGALSPLSLFSPHPRLDPVTGELFNFGLALDVSVRRASVAALRCYRVDRRGRMETMARVPLDALYVNHDFAITERYLVFVLAPLLVDPRRAIDTALGLGTFESATTYREGRGTRVILVPRSGGRPRIVECPPLVYVHFDNAYEDRGDVVIDLVRYPAWEPLAAALRAFRSATAPSGTLTRLRVRPDDHVELSALTDVAGEFPQHDPRRTGRAHRFAYISAADGRSIAKVDHASGRHRAHPFGPRDLPGEPIFVPARAGADEDEGFVLSLVYRHEAHRTDLVVLDARDVEREPLLVAPLPEPLFPGFHGSFVAA